MAGIEKQRAHMAATHGHGAHAHANHHHPHPGHGHHPAASTTTPHHANNIHAAGHVDHDHHHPHHPPIKYRPGINVIAFFQLISGLLALNFEAISAVLYRASASKLLHGVEFAGLYVSVYTMITGIIGLLSIRKSFGHKVRMCCFISDILLTIFLALQTFTMSCASAAMLVIYTISWDSVLSLINRYSSSANLNLMVGTTTTTAASVTLPEFVTEELSQDFMLLIGLRSVLFVIYFILFVSSILASCFGCCNYCKCFAAVRQPPDSPEMQHDHVINVSAMELPRAQLTGQQTTLVEKTEVVLKPGAIPVVETHTEVSDHEKKHKSHTHHHKHKA